MDKDNVAAVAIQPFSSLWRRFGAILYDWLLLIALQMLAAALIVVPLGLLGIGADALRQHLLFQLYLFIIVPMTFFCGFWVYGGQTLGMHTWRIKVVTVSGDPLTLKLAMLRFITTSLSIVALGAGFFWSLIDKEGLTWHDRLSGTRLILLDRRLG